MRPYAFALFMAVALPSSTVTAQLIPGDDHACQTCRIQSRTLFTIGTQSGPAALPGMPFNVMEDELGRIWVFFDSALPMVFDASGKFVATVGRRGDGPGEFRLPRSMVTVAGDSILVFDAAGRAVLLDHDLNASRSIVIPGRGVWTALVLQWPDRVILNAVIPTRASIGWPLHMADLSAAQASIDRSFGPNGGRAIPGAAGRRVQQSFLIGRTSGEFWSIEIGRYRLSKWSGSERIAGIERRPSWFQGQSMLTIGRHRPSEPRISGIISDSEGRFWVYTLVAASDFQRAWRNATPRPDGSYPSEIRASDIIIPDLYKTRVEVLDPENELVITAADYEGMVLSTLASGRVVVYTQDANGVPQLRIVAFTMDRS
ncbi:MAG: 6-bladed beta-propeller [Gemmatimonadota bacterium]